MQLELALRLSETRPADAAQVIKKLHGEATSLVGYVRGLVVGRESEHQPEVSGGVAALRGMLTKMRRSFADRLELSFDIDERLGQACAETGTAAFWIVHEAIINVLKHAAATRCRVTVVVIGTELWIRVRDDGIGLIPLPGPHSSGTANMAERAVECGGWCTVEPDQPHGVLVLACLPMDR